MCKNQKSAKFSANYRHVDMSIVGNVDRTTRKSPQICRNLVQSSLSNPALVYPAPLQTSTLSGKTDFFSFIFYAIIRHLNSSSGSDFLQQITQTVHNLIF